MSTADGITPISVPRLLATLLLIGEEHGLPDSIHMDATFENGCADVKLASFADQDQWAEALGAKPGAKFTSTDGTRQCRNYTARRDGWFITVSASEPATPPRTELPAETLAALEQIANPTPAVSDERAEEILGTLNLFIARIGADPDYRRDEAIAWAIRQPEVRSLADEPLTVAEVRLHDGTVICWSPDVEQWEFAPKPSPASRRPILGTSS